MVTKLSFILKFIFNYIISSLMIARIASKAKHFLGLMVIFSSVFVAFVPIIRASEKDLVALISATEKQYAIPDGLLLAIAKTESNLKEFAFNIGGRAVFAENFAEALAIANKSLQEEQPGNIDIGVMQINWRWHGKNFPNVATMLDPAENINYAAKFLANLKKQHGSWHHAVRYYHSKIAAHHQPYSRKVVLCWLGLEKNSIRKHM
jgi:hypothetical protein